MKRLFHVLVLALFLTGVSQVIHVNAEEQIEVEQIQELMPTIKMYVNSSFDIQDEDIEVWLEEAKLDVCEVGRFAEQEEKISYYILTDISASIPNKYFKSIKNTLTDFVTNKLQEDYLTLITFGDEVSVVFEGTGEDSQYAMEAIDKLQNDDKETHLFEAIKMTADLSDSIQDGSRKVVLVITDGEDFATGKATKSEVEQELGIRNIPVYGMGISDTQKDNLNSFGEITRSLGGELYIFNSDETENIFAQWIQRLNDTWVITCKAKNNVIDNQLHNVRLAVLSKSLNRNKEVFLSHYESDTVPPKIQTVLRVLEDETKIKIVFSESVDNISNVNHWKVTKDGENVEIASVDYADDSCSVYIRLNGECYKGLYTIEASGVTDSSMEKNLVTKPYTVQLTGNSQPEEEGTVEASTKNDSNETENSKLWWIVILAFLLILILIILFIWLRIKKNKGIVYVEGKATLMTNVEEKHKIHVETRMGMPICFEIINSSLGDNNKIKTSINGSLIVGRAEYCDICIDDAGLSKQHFALEEEKNELYITDLHSTNGTYLNGVLLNTKQRLQKEDMIQAGGLSFRIRW